MIIKSNLKIPCICGNKNHTKECKSNKRRITANNSRVLKYHQLKDQHKCVHCRKKVKPIKVYPKYCDKCKLNQNKKTLSRKR